MHKVGELPGKHTGRDCARLCGRICAKCVERLRGELRTLLELYRESDHALTAASPRLRERVSGSRGVVGIVLDERAVDMRARMTEVLASWARLVVEERGSEVPRPREREVTNLVPFLRQQVRWIAGHPAAVDFDEEVAELLGEFGGLFGPGQARRFPLGPCVRPGCAGTLHGVVRSDGAADPSHVSCDAGHALPPRQWLQVAGRMAEGAA
ncbi:OvmZ protein [Streptomyces sp. NBC_00289]|uniref:OvmZ protein n=1 Tax=Streptomyces sp. NBC_00289 TaxID=2975703 RepID=UPI00324770FA